VDRGGDACVRGHGVEKRGGKQATACGGDTHIIAMHQLVDKNFRHLVRGEWAG
jgi:hypothetical protein